MSALLARLTARTMLGHIRHVRAVPPFAATGLVDRVYRQLVRDFGILAPPIALHAPAPRALAASWLMLRESLVASGLVGRDTKEAVAAAVSLANRCPYCVEVHGATLVGLSRDADAAAVAADQIDTVSRDSLRSVALWARGSGGALSPPAGHAAELVGVAVTFHYLNRMVNVFLPPSPLPAGLPPGARRRARRVAARIMSWLARPRRSPGDSLDLLPTAPLPADMSWAAGNAGIASAFASASVAIEYGGTASVPDRVRELVLDRLAGWDGSPPGISSRAWLDEAVGGLPDEERPAGRLALVTALASFQAGDSIVEDFRRGNPADSALVELTAWASLAAARRLGHRLGSTLSQVSDGDPVLRG